MPVLVVDQIGTPAVNRVEVVWCTYGYGPVSRSAVPVAVAAGEDDFELVV